jgi:transcriptional regulator with XRE-family HTH domain
MASVERLFNRGTRRAAKALADVGEEFRHARLRLGLSQRRVADAVGIDRADYCRVEAGKVARLPLLTAFRIAAVLGLDLSLRAFPGGGSIRDAGQAKREQRLIACVGRPLTWRAEVPVRGAGDPFDQRSWDLVLFGGSQRTALEFEVRLYDLQAQERRWRLKRRDDPVEHFLLVVADTRSNRRVLAEYADLLADLPRLRTATVLATLRAGQHPPTGIILL